MNDQTNLNEKESIQKEFTTIIYLYLNLDYFIENLKLSSEIIADRYNVEKTLELNAELEKNYSKILADLQMLRDSMKKQKSIYELRLQKLQKKLAKSE